MQRWVSLFLASLAIATAIAVSYRGLTTSLDRLPASSADAGHAGLEASPDGGPLGVESLGDDTTDEIRLRMGLESDGGEVESMAGQGAPSSLEAHAPRQVRAGIILLSYSGAEGASPKARPKAQVADIAQRLAAQAKVDFRGAAAHGDPGSTEDVGRIPRGMLEPAAEFALFTLPVGGVSDPIDTARGYWIVKRLQ